MLPPTEIVMGFLIITENILLYNIQDDHKKR